MKNTTFALGAAAILGVSGVASASFVGAVFDSYAVEAGGQSYAVIDAYIEFDSADDTVLNIFNVDIFNVNGTAFNHNDFNTLSGLAGAWNVVQSGNIPGVVDSSIDSLVLVGGPIGGTNTTALDPSFDPSTGGSVPFNAGWFNSNPPNLQGRADAGTLRTWVGRFVIEGTDSAETLSFAFNMGYNQGLGTGAQFAYNDGATRGPAILVDYVPAPGAIALLGLAGLAGRRRRN
ncbi:MAG: hypothetical protein ACO3P9_08730 [Phycisphaerales bacterium]|jgi:hypothetical protein